MDVEVTNKVGENMWTAVGFSNDQSMPNSDIVLGYFDGEGSPVVKDMFTPGYAPPSPDDSQDISAASLKRENGVNVLKFKKKINSGDDKDVDLAKGIHMLYPYSGGQVSPEGSFILKHSNTPFVEAEKMQFREISDLIGIPSLSLAFRPSPPSPWYEMVGKAVAFSH